MNKLPNVIIGMAVCPFCHRPEHTVRSTRRLENGDVLRYVTCDSCSRRYTTTTENGPELRITEMNGKEPNKITGDFT